MDDDDVLCAKARFDRLQCMADVAARRAYSTKRKLYVMRSVHYLVIFGAPKPVKPPQWQRRLPLETLSVALEDLMG